MSVRATGRRRSVASGLGVPAGHSVQAPGTSTSHSSPGGGVSVKAIQAPVNGASASSRRGVSRLTFPPLFCTKTDMVSFTRIAGQGPQLRVWNFSLTICHLESGGNDTSQPLTRSLTQPLPPPPPRMHLLPLPFSTLSLPQGSASHLPTSGLGRLRERSGLRPGPQRPWLTGPREALPLRHLQ